VFHLTVAAVHLFTFWQHSNCYIPVPTAVIAQVSIMRNPSLFITVSVVPTCSATQSAKQELINTSSDVLQLSACSVRGDKRHTVAGRSQALQHHHGNYFYKKFPFFVPSPEGGKFVC
jgi:hypothetical protein